MDASFWNGKRPAGVGDSVNPDEYSSALSVINAFLNENSSLPAFTGIGHTLTYADIDLYSQQFAAYIQRNTDLQPGDRIAIQMPNLLQYPIVVYGALRAGLVIVNTNPLYTAREMLHQFKDSGAKALVFFENFGDLVEEVVGQTDIKHLFVTRLADMVPAPKRQVVNFLVKYVKKMVPRYSLPKAVPLLDAFRAAKASDYQPIPEGKLSDPLVLQYTGGTTGVAKGAILTNRNLIANMLQSKEMLSQVDQQGQKILKTGRETLIAPLPLYHIYAFTVHLMCMPFMGNHSILIANPRDTDTFIKSIKPWRFTAFIGLNTLFASLLNHPKFKECDLSGLKVTLSGGTALQEATAQRWHKETGCIISEAYGLTECSPAVCMNPAGDLSQPGTAGLPIPSTELKTIDENGGETAIGEPGELCVRGPQVMSGYWQRVEATAEVLSTDGWLKTGDVAVIQEDGFVRIVDRIKDMILVSGFNVYPNEIEDVVSGHPKVANCAAIGVPDENSGEKVKLFVIKSDDSLTADELLSWCRDYLTAYKVPKVCEFRDELPMTPVGKILRKDLR
ncbi:AMP-binding protein [Salinisphaera sp. G21_0]|uniref:AMP-binding protein n=1 Tax=Salinisphaera sp. G21_0 TaxID=2821094 RepID=UPI001ADBD055|nr:AMP-binding protein [Salinisphaera sp. G21_0]MBO9479840.1 AMP-binding protein [Salinisphaera sp. G21_0]